MSLPVSLPTGSPHLGTPPFSSQGPLLCWTAQRLARLLPGQDWLSTTTNQELSLTQEAPNRTITQAAHRPKEEKQTKDRHRLLPSSSSSSMPMESLPYPQVLRKGLRWGSTPPPDTGGGFQSTWDQEGPPMPQDSTLQPLPPCICPSKTGWMLSSVIFKVWLFSRGLHLWHWQGQDLQGDRLFPSSMRSESRGSPGLQSRPRSGDTQNYLRETQ